MRYLLKRLWVNITIIILEVINAITQDALVYEVTSKGVFPWLNILKNPLLWVLLTAGIIYNVVVTIVIKNEKSVDNQVMLEIHQLAYIKLHEDYIDDVIKNGSRKEKRKVLKVLEKGMKK